MKLTVARLREVLNYDPDTGIFTWKIATSWRVKAGQRAGTVCSNGYRQIRLDGVFCYEHRIAWAISTGVFPKNDIDHIDLNKSNNKLENLREATRQQNCANRTARRGSESGLKGVTRKRSKWAARIKIDGITHRLGVFDTPQEAHDAYSAAAKRFLGEFARAV